MLRPKGPIIDDKHSQNVANIAGQFFLLKANVFLLVVGCANCLVHTLPHSVPIQVNELLLLLFLK